MTKRGQVIDGQADLRVYFWQRGPRWLNLLLAGSLLAAVVVGAIVGSLATAAQSASDVALVGELYSVPLHVLAMTAVAALAVSTAAGLHVLGRTELAALVLVGAVLGPLTLVAVPVNSSMVNEEMSSAPALWWRLAVGATLLAVLAPWTWWVTRCLHASRTTAESPGETPREFAWLLPDLTFLVTAGLGYAAYVQAPMQANEPFTPAMVGWATLAAGIVVVVAFGARAWVAGALLIGVAAMLAIITAAYTRPGGWPGVAGWESSTSPIITAWAATVVLLAAPIVGLALRLGLVGLRRAGAARLSTAVAAH